MSNGIRFTVSDFDSIITEEAEKRGLIYYNDFPGEFTVYEPNLLTPIAEFLFGFKRGKNPVNITGIISTVDGHIDSYKILPSKRTTLIEEYECALRERLKELQFSPQ
jgi:hypothetical protein